VLAWVAIVQSLQSLNTEVLQVLGLTSRVFRVSGAGFLPAYLWRERRGSADIRGIVGQVHRSGPPATITA
jgi:hypothetical protein